MSNLPFDQKLQFDTELSVSFPFTGAAQVLGKLKNNPVILLVKNQSSVAVFFADNPGATKGTTMVAGEEFVLDCRGNHGTAVNMAFPVNTTFYVTSLGGGGTAGDTFKVSVLYAY